MPDPVQERFFAERLLSLLNLEPANLVVSDKPDIRFELGGKRTGLEITEATPEEHRRAEKALDAAGWNGFVFPANWQHRDERRSTAELVAEGIDVHSPWVDSFDALRRWAGRIEERLCDKQRAFTHPNFQRFDENWLLIADLKNSAITHEPHLVEAKRFFHSLVQTFRPEVFFDRSFILTSDAGLIDWDHRQSKITWSVTKDHIFTIP